jgi:hypothetical protein
MGHDQNWSHPAAVKTEVKPSEGKGILTTQLFFLRNNVLAPFKKLLDVLVLFKKNLYTLS